MACVDRSHGCLQVRVSLPVTSHLPSTRPMLTGVLEGATSVPRHRDDALKPCPRARRTRASATPMRGQSLEGPSSSHRASPHPTALTRAPLRGHVLQAPGHRAAASTCQPRLSQQCPHPVVAAAGGQSCLLLGTCPSQCHLGREACL